MTVGFFDEELQGYADWELWLRICREHKFIGIPDILIKYRIHAGGLSSNVQHMTEDRLRAIRKHFGPPDGEAATWTADKRRAYAYAYRTAAFEYSMQGKTDEAWRYLDQAVTIWPDIFARLDTFYELACGNQPRGYRGHPEPARDRAEWRRALVKARPTILTRTAGRGTAEKVSPSAMLTLRWRCSAIRPGTGERAAIICGRR